MNRLRKIPKVTLVSLLVVLILLGTFHLWLISHAKKLLSEIVHEQSQGKYHLQLDKIRYNYLKLRLEVYQPVLTSLDTSNHDSFEMHAQRISFQLEKLWPLVTGRHLLIDSIAMDKPYFSVTHQNNNRLTQTKKPFSLSLEMENLYQDIQSVLTTLKVANLHINKGTFALSYFAQKRATTLEIKNIDFFIKGLKIDSSSISQSPSSYSDDIQLRIGGQTIQFPDGSKSIRFSSFRLMVNSGNLELDSCNISGGVADSATATFNIFAEKMRIRNMRVAGQDSSDYNQLDSLFFTRPRVTFAVKINKSKNDSTKTIAAALNRITTAAFGKTLARYVSINNVNFDIEVERKEQLSRVNVVQDRLEVTNLGLGLFPSMPISADNIRFGLKKFEDYFRDSTYLVQFDSVRINKNQFSLFNFKLESTEKAKKGEQKVHITVLQIEGIDWLELFIHKRLMASNFTLIDPFISIIAAGNPKSQAGKKNNNIDSVLRQMFSITNIAISNGTINYAFGANEFLNIKKINTELTSVTIPEFQSINEVQKIVRQFKTGELVYQKNGWKMYAKNMLYGKGNSFSAATLDLENNLQNLHIRANNVNVSGMSDDVKSKALIIGKLSWGDASIVTDMNTEKTNGNSARSNVKLSIDAINGGATELNIRNNKLHVTAKISKLKTTQVEWSSGKPIALHDLFAEGTSIHTESENAYFHAGKFLLRDLQPSYISDVAAGFPSSNRFITVSIKRVNFETIVRQAILKQYMVNNLKFLQPSVTVNINTTQTVTGVKEEKPFPSINLSKIEITDPEIIFQKNVEQSPLQLRLGQSFISMDGIQTSQKGDQIILKNFQLNSDNFSIQDKDSLHFFSVNGKAKLALESFTLHSTSPDSTGKWQLSEGNLQLLALELLNKKKSGQSDTLALASLHLRNLTLNEKNTSDPAQFFSTRPPVTFENAELLYKNEKSRFKVMGINASYNSFSLDSFSVHPQIDMDSFMATQAFQKDYIHVETGPVFLHQIDAGAWLKDSVINIGNVQIMDAKLTATRDKQLPVQTDIVKALPVSILRKLKLNTHIDSMNLSNATIAYSEVGDKTKQKGTIHFNRLKATVKNIKNYGLTPGDSLGIVASAYLMDSVFLTLKFKESYEDSLVGFPVVVKAEPFDLQILNPFLLPVMSVKIKSGKVDFLEMRAIGREYLSLGELKFYYHNLKVEFLKGGNEERKTFLTNLMTFAANSFVIKKNNNWRTGKIYYERSRNRSVFNYLVRMMASGAASSVGAKRNKKYNREYRKRIKELQLPEIDY